MRIYLSNYSHVSINTLLDRTWHYVLELLCSIIPNPWFCSNLDYCVLFISMHCIASRNNKRSVIPIKEFGHLILKFRISVLSRMIKDLSWKKSVRIFAISRHMYRKVASSRLVYYSIMNSFGQRSQHINIKFTLHKYCY